MLQKEYTNTRFLLKNTIKNKCKLQIHVMSNGDNSNNVHTHKVDKKLSYCWETVQRESMQRIAEMDVEMTT